MSKLAPGFTFNKREEQDEDILKEEAIELQILHNGKEGIIVFGIGSTILQIDFSIREIQLGCKKFIYPIIEEKFQIFIDNDVIELFSGKGMVYCVEKTDNCSICVMENTCNSGMLEIHWLLPILY